MEDLKSRLAGQNLDLAAYLKSREMDEEKFLNEEAKPIAVKRLERSLVLDAIAKAEKIEVSQDLLQSSFQQTLGEFQGDSSFQKMMRGKSQPPRQLMNAVAMESANRAYVQLTLNRLKDIATGQAPDITDNSIPEGKAKKTTARKAAAAKKPSSNKTAKASKIVTEVAATSNKKQTTS